MELDSFLHQIQGILKKNEKHYGNLCIPNKGNEDKISKIVNSLTKIISKAKKDDKKLQKLYILLFLNTESDVYTDLKKSRKYAHLVGFFPKLSQDIFMKMVLEFELGCYFYASISHLSTPLSSQIVKIFSHTLNGIDLFKGVEFVENVIAHLFNKIIVTETTDPYYSYLNEAFQQLLLHYDPELGGSIKRMRQWDRNKMKHYAGLVLASLLSLLEKCTLIYSQKDKFLTHEDYSILKIHLDQDTCSFKPVVKHISECSTVHQCYDHVIAKCLDNVCSADIDIWLFWVEIELDDNPDTENTLQRFIGENAFKCREVLKEAECLGISTKQTADMISKLKMLSIQPRIKDEPLELDEVINNIRDPNKDKGQWVKYLAMNKSYATQLHVIEIIKENLTLLQSSEILRWVDFLLPSLKCNTICESHKCMFLEIVKAVNIETQIEITKRFVTIFNLSNQFKRDDFHVKLTEIFNKVINEEEKEKELYPHFIQLALQSPNEVILRAVAEGITSEVRGHLMADILSKLKAFCDVENKVNKTFLVSALNKLLLLLPDLPENQQHNFPLFVRELVMRKILQGKQFIKRSLMVQLRAHLQVENWIVIIVSLETLSELIDINCYHYIPASIMMLMQVLEAYRWSPLTFNQHAVQVCMLTLQLVRQLISKWYQLDFSDDAKKLLVQLSDKHFEPINRYHLSRVLTEEKLPSDLAMQLTYRMHYGIGLWSILHVTADERTQLVHDLCFVLPVMTQIEWNELFCVVSTQCSEFMCLFHIVIDSLILCLDSAKVMAQPSVMECLVFTAFNLVKCVEVELMRWNENDNEYRIIVLKKLCQLISNFPPIYQASLCNTVNVLEKLLPKDSRRSPLSNDEVISVTATLASIHCDSMRQSLANTFLQMIHR